MDVFPSMRSPPEAVRASLEAVRAAQQAARVRARREMWQARAVVGSVAAVVAIAGLVVWPRIHAARAARAASAVTTPAPARLVTSPSVPAPAPAPGGLLAAGVADLPATKEAPGTAAGAAVFDACRDSYQAKRWRAAAAACAAAFAARPDDAKLALRVAEAEYARDDLTEARTWAQRTLALDAKQADALAILGRSEQRTGHGEAAARAFRRYLALAPRGWHASEARAVLRAERPVRPVQSAARPGQSRERDDSATAPAVAAPSSTAPATFSPPALAPQPAP